MNEQNGFYLRDILQVFSNRQCIYITSDVIDRLFIMQESNVPMELGGLDPRYECPICLSCLKEPILTSCGHKFCTTCLNLWFETKGGCCPVDGTKLDKTVDLFPDHFTRREILSQKSICKLCNLEISMNEMDEHLATHSKSSEESDKEQCPFKSIGCEMEVPKNRLKEHLEMEIHHHLCLVKNSHEKLRDNVKNNDKMSEALAQETLLWEPQEKDKEQQNTTLLRTLYERVIILEQRCHEQNAQIQKYRAELSKAEAKIQEVSLQHACGQYLWSISQFSKKVAAMRLGDKRLFFSDGFYTSPIGYKICGRINLSPINGDQLSLLIHLMKSSHDCALDWPFTGRIHLAVIHPTKPEMSVKETMMTRPELDSFKRPQREMNTKAFGYPQFISINDIFKNGFLTEDTLLVKIHIQCV